MAGCCWCPPCLLVLLPAAGGVVTPTLGGAHRARGPRSSKQQQQQPGRAGSKQLSNNPLLPLQLLFVAVALFAPIAAREATIETSLIFNNIYLIFTLLQQPMRARSKHLFDNPMLLLCLLFVAIASGWASVTFAPTGACQATIETPFAII